MSQFPDIRNYVALPRVVSLRLSPDGTRLVSVVQSLNPDGKSYGTALWEIPLDPDATPYRLTRSAKGEAGAQFAPGGEVLFVSRRPDATVKDGDEEVPALWLLPERGEPRRIATRPGGIGGVRAAGGTVVYAAQVLPGDAATEEERRKARKDAGISAILHESYPIRYWDHDLGPAETRLFAAAAGDGPGAEGAFDGAVDLTPEPGRALDNADFALTPDGSTVITTWRVPLPNGESRHELAAFDVAAGPGSRRTLAASESHDFGGPLVVSPDGRFVACTRERHATETVSSSAELWVVDLATGEGRALGGELFPAAVAWAPSSDALFVAADHLGRRPVFRIPLDVSLDSPVERLTPDDGAYYDLCPAPDGSLYALRGAVDSPPRPVRISPDGSVTDLPSPTPALDLPGTLTEVSAVADDGTEIRGWLVLPAGASAESPAPFLLWIHGGPLGSWNDWSWRWNPWIMAKNGYAVLLPDPCLSTGYGQAMIDRGWGEWGPVTHGDLMAITDECLKRPDIDDQRIAAMGGSFGGYMANWVAGHTDRFKAIVTHASLWNLDQFAGTTDASMYWQREFGRPGSDRLARLSPHHSLDKITTPMLVIHGDKDYRVPIGEGLRLWWDLQRSGVESKFLYFPDENHWVLNPGNAVAWYETVLAFLEHHVLGAPWTRPTSTA
ncbi:S9 family peptidase [Planotetraspora sp. A-T 1434]|uniref:S9 family peptidase n=1 Tax=Planotetraspora sp. A-T 1434 TaxID=2979219 RepID=UPI0021BF8E16|nr:S9 family peptidase [Planotetraspora sp. A-T 1434]MCT9929529.1 S9 family peptidase [Planotetraspora sp. A-T 1434]